MSAGTAGERLRDWVASDYIAIREKGIETSSQPNMQHFIHCSIDQSHCPVGFGDIRTTKLYVPSFAAGDVIPKSVFMAKLKLEVPEFIRTLVDLELTPPEGRLRISAIDMQGG